MFLEYEKPFVEIVEFAALERLASNRNAIESRDNGNGDDSTDTKYPSLGEGVEIWP